MLVNGPIVVSDRTTLGWNDLLVKVAGGGAQPGYRHLQFDGHAYPSNPSLESAADQEAEQSGTLLAIDESTIQETAPLLSPPPCDR
ncbi:MAG: hypothetical protein F6K16_31885 [Symploca sp. SIO2B6]|nr:hypothetical protein [Symploca sp. SIO2B6]